MTDAAFSTRMDATTVIDRVAPPRRVRQRAFDSFQRAMHGDHPAIEGREWTPARIAAAGLLVTYAIGSIVVVWSVMAVHEGWFR